MFRKIATRFSPTTDIVQDGDKFQIKFVAGFKTKEWKFTVGEDFEDKPMGWSNDTMIVRILLLACHNLFAFYLSHCN